MDANEPEQADQQEPIEDIQQDEIKQQLMDEYAKCILIPFAERKFIKRPGKQHEKKLEKAVENVNKTLEVIPVSTEISDVTQLNNLLYASAITAIKIADLEKQCLPANKQQQKKKEWHVNFQIRIDNLRTEINKIMQISNTNQSAKMKKNANSMKNKYNIDTEEKRQITLETLRQRLKALNNRLSRYLKREKQYQQNKEFNEKPSRLFDQLRGNRVTINSPPEKEETVNFWRPMFETEKSYNKEATWLPEYINSTDGIIPATYTPITESEIQKATSKFANWKSPGIDRIQNFWWKKFSSLHKITAAILNNLMVEPNITPQWLTTGRTTLVAKKKETQDPSNYRPITCLPIIYKIHTSVITSRITHHIETNNIIPPEQKGNSTNTFGTIDQLLINKMIQEDAEKRKKNLSKRIDYRKAFDSVPHDWIIDTLKIHKFDATITNFTEKQ